MLKEKGIKNQQTFKPLTKEKLLPQKLEDCVKIKIDLPEPPVAIPRQQSASHGHNDAHEETKESKAAQAHGNKKLYSSKGGEAHGAGSKPRKESHHLHANAQQSGAGAQANEAILTHTIASHASHNAHG